MKSTDTGFVSDSTCERVNEILTDFRPDGEVVQIKVNVPGQVDPNVTSLEVKGPAVDAEADAICVTPFPGLKHENPEEFPF